MAKTKRRFKETPKWRTKQSLRNKRRRKARKDKVEKRKLKNSFYVDIPDELAQVSYPDEGDAELCKARVAGGMKCWCAEHCDCRRCQKERREKGEQRCLTPIGDCIGAIYECPDACRECSNYKPCWRW